ncbi:hypothetical protein SCHPADRAFT_752951 [Schizopora paradoxa]|uniref:Uncharacterized protein n=1 Tax=Schizopora paradoxa TaxID=27342 RepID=A0A0H2QZR8_9AGAM|nr:hypothetical protein SCHPADRAFT_752951 [Schizopora paradoxa]
MQLCSDKRVRNLYGIDYVREHGRISTLEFERLWISLDPWTKSACGITTGYVLVCLLYVHRFTSNGVKSLKLRQKLRNLTRLQPEFVL